MAGAVALASVTPGGPAQAATGMPPDVRAAIIACESGGNPTAQNTESTASGLYQFLNGTWRHYGGTTARAKDAPVTEQHAVADRAYTANGLRDWDASRACWSEKVGKHASGQDAPAVREARAPRHAKHTYTVKAGDTLAEIAAAHGTTWRKLYAANCGITNPALIYPGETINV